MQTITIDLKKMPEIKDFLVDKEPGDAVTLHATIKSLDDQTAVLTVEEIGEAAEEKEKPTMDEEQTSDMAAPPNQAGASPDMADSARDLGGMEQSAM
jgi:hypothetical protein